jgi:hypothetical protein
LPAFVAIGVLAAAAGVFKAASAHADLPQPQVAMTWTSTYVSFRNQDASWRIYTHCADGVGPGYVARVTMNGTGRVLLDDTNGGRKDVNRDGFYRLYTGLGKLVFLDAVAKQNAPIDWRQNNLADTSGTNNVFIMDSRHCAGQVFSAGSALYPYGIANPATVDPGVNNGASGPLTAPTATNDVGSLDEAVVFQDRQTRQLLKIVYRWRVYAHVVKMWADVSGLCNGKPGATVAPCGPTPSWIKGPKFIAGLNGNPDGTGFTRMTVWDGNATTPTPLCAIDYKDPSRGSTKCAAVARSRVQFNYGTRVGTSISATDPTNCSDVPLRRCFNASFRSYVPNTAIGAAAPPWYGASGGLDNWAALAGGAETPLQGAGTPCAGQTTPSYSPNNPLGARQWEIPGEKLVDNNGDGLVDYRDQFSFADGYYFGWRDCINPADDPALFQAYSTSTWGTYAAFSFNTPNANSFAATEGG